jgi:hypothetical protein
MALAPGQWASSRAPSWLVAAVLAARWSSRSRARACRWRVAASKGRSRCSRWPSVRSRSASFQLSPGSDLARAAPQRARVALKALGCTGTTGWPAASSRSTTTPLVVSIATGSACGRPWRASRPSAWSKPTSSWPNDQRSTTWPALSITVMSWVSLAQSQPTCMRHPPSSDGVRLTGRCRGPVAACSLFGPRWGVSLKAVMRASACLGAAQLILAVERHESLAVPRQEPGSTTC